MNIIPEPQQVKQFDGKCELPTDIGINFGGFGTYSAEAFAERAKVRIKKGEFIRLEKDCNFTEEEYCLFIDKNNIRIKAASERGVIWAFTTLANLISNGTLDCCEIRDMPKYAHRGVNLDCSRHFFSAEEVKKIVEGISLGKINVLHWHLSDDQGWRIESKSYPMLNQIGTSFYTQEEIREVVRYAKVRGVQVIPEIEMPGHMTALLAAYPEYGCFGKEVKLATGGGIYPVVLCAGKEQTYELIDNLFKEILPLFECDIVHIGGDETPKTEWEQCPHCQKKMRELGLTDWNDLQGYFTDRVCKILRRYGKRAICWNETLLASNYPKDITVQYWTLNHRRTMEPFVEAGGKWIYSDMFELYLDYPHSMTSLKKLYQTKAHLGKKDFSNSKGLLGMECCLWTEHISEIEQLEKRLFPRIYAFAEICWRENGKYKDFEKRLKGMMQKPYYAKFCITEENWWNPCGKERRREAIGFFTAINEGMSKEVKEQTVQSSKPNKEFAKSFMTKFFRVTDIPTLLKTMTKNERY